MHTTNLKILGIAGSLRTKSLNKYLLLNAKDLAPPQMSFDLFDLDGLPLYNEDIDKLQEPARVYEFRQKLSESDALLISTPEYNYSIPGVLKNAIDWASRPPVNNSLYGKPCGIMGVSGGMSGTMKAQMHLRQIFVFNNVLCMNRPELVIQKGAEKFDEKGVLMDEKTRESLRIFLSELNKWILQFKQFGD